MHAGATAKLRSYCCMRKLCGIHCTSGRDRLQVRVIICICTRTVSRLLLCCCSYSIKSSPAKLPRSCDRRLQNHHNATKASTYHARCCKTELFHNKAASGASYNSSTAAVLLLQCQVFVHIISRLLPDLQHSSALQNRCHVGQKPSA